MTTETNEQINFDYSKYGFRDEEQYTYKSEKGLSEEVVRTISRMKGEPEWMLKRRLKALEIFNKKPLPVEGVWANPKLAELDFQDIYYYVRPGEKSEKSWDDVPENIKNTFERLGIPEAEQKFLAGVGAQYESESVYHSLREEWEKQGVVFLDMDNALREFPEVVKEYFGTIIPSADNKFAALNTAVWSGGSFVYVPKGVKVTIPLQAYFRINAENMGQFERTLIIVDEDAEVTYIEGCFTAGALVLTREGEKPIEEIQIGDEVMTHKGRYRKVYNLMNRPYQGRLFNINYFGDSSHTLQVTEEHPLMVVKREQANERNKSFNQQWIFASMVEQGDYLVIPRAKPATQSTEDVVVTIPFGNQQRGAVERQVIFPQEPDFYRLLGYYHAEGHVSKENYLTLSFHAQETAYIEDAKAILSHYFGKEPIMNTEYNNGQTMVLCSTEAARAFAYEIGSNVYEKVVPNWLRNAPDHLLAQWVRGAWCGDGSYDAKKNMFRFNTISRNLAYAFRNALLRLGVVASINIQKRAEPRQDIYAVIISSPYNPVFGEIVGVDAPAGSWSGSPFHMDEDYLYVPVRSISVEEADTEVYNFSVEEDESYVAEGVVSHNCTAPVYTTNSLHSAVVEIIVKNGGKCRYTTIQNWAPNIFNLVTKRAVTYENAQMEWVDGNIGCLAEGSTVTTPNGIKPIESLEVGEKVLSYDDATGEFVFRPVVAKRYSGEQPVHTVSIGQRKIDVTANHPFYSYTYDPDVPKKLGRYKLAYVRADHLSEAIIPQTSIDYGVPYELKHPFLTTTFESSNQYQDNLVMERSRESRLYPIQGTTNDLMWMFGYWVGDGNLDVKEAKTEGVLRWAKVGFSSPETDRARERLVSTMAEVINAEPTIRTDGVHLAWNSTELAELFRINGFYGKARDKRVPQWVWSLPQSQRLAFIAGYIDADGTIIDRRFSIKSVNKELLEDISSLLVTLGITSRLYTEFDEPRTVTIMGYECTAHGSHRLVFAIDDRMLDYVSPSLRQIGLDAEPAQFTCNRKVGRSIIELPQTVQIVKVDVSEPTIELVPTWDIEVEETGNFVSQGFIVHNSRLTMKYPAVYMMGRGGKGEVLSVAYAGEGQHQDAGAKMVHAAPDTTSRITNKSVSKGGGRTTYRGLARVEKGATNAKVNVVCDALILDNLSASDTIPYIEVEEDSATIAHEATVGKIGEEQLFYLMSRGLTEPEALSMIVLGFMEPFTRELPMEYAVELNRLIQMEMEGSVG